jgi:hypothetical protein
LIVSKALKAVLKLNFAKVGQAAEKIERGEFVIHDSALKRDIDPSHRWESCFRPGQYVNMEIVFKRTVGEHDVVLCPACGARCQNVGL